MKTVRMISVIDFMGKIGPFLLEGRVLELRIYDPGGRLGCRFYL